MIHQDVQQLPCFWLIVPEPQHPEDHDGVVPGARLVEVLDREAGAAAGLEQGALPGVVSAPRGILTVRGAQGDPAVPAPVDQHRQSLVAVEADRSGVGVWPHGPGGVCEEDLASQDVPGGHQEPPAPLLRQDRVGGRVMEARHASLIIVTRYSDEGTFVTKNVYFEKTGQEQTELRVTSLHSHGWD